MVRQVLPSSSSNGPFQGRKQDIRMYIEFDVKLGCVLCVGGEAGSGTSEYQMTVYKRLPWAKLGCGLVHSRT